MTAAAVPRRMSRRDLRPIGVVHASGELLELTEGICSTWTSAAACWMNQSSLRTSGGTLRVCHGGTALGRVANRFNAG